MLRSLILTALALTTVPAFAQQDLSGNWTSRQHQDWEERGPGPEVVDYLGLPINAAAREKALLYQPSQIAMPERQCLYYSTAYVVFGPQGIKIWSDSDPDTGRIIAWNISAAIDRAVITIWMDGRPHPPAVAPHTYQGFTTGEWDGDILTYHTTHMKASYIRRNGVPISDQATVTAHIIRHGDELTITQMVDDPVYLTEPYVISRVWQLDPHGNMTTVPRPCVPEIEVVRPEGSVPHFLPGENKFAAEMTSMYHIPEEAVLGGAETALPEYRKKLKAAYTPPEKCVRYCCGWGGAMGNNVGFGCITGGSPVNGR